MKNDRRKRLIKNTTIFAISNISTKLIVFLLLPIYTWKLSTSEYGIVDLLFTISNFIYPLLTLNIVESIFRFSMDKNIDNNKIVYNGLICNMICILFGLVIFPVLSIFKEYSDYAVLFYTYIISLSMNQTLLAFLKGQEKLKLFAIGNIINTILVAVLNIIFLVGLNMSIDGYFLAYIISNIITITYSIIFGKIKISFDKKNYDKKLFKEMLKYSLVLLPTSFMWWIINSSDRVMIASWIGDGSNGIYAVAYKLPSMLTMIATIFNQAWLFTAINEKNSNDYEKYSNNIFNKLLLLLCISLILLLLIIKPLFSIYVAKDYYDAWKYVPFLGFGYIFMTLSTFISSSYNAHKDSKGFLFSAITGAITNIILNIIFIPIFGLYGAALATLLSYVSVFLYRIIDTRKYVKTILNRRHVITLLILLLAAGATYLNIQIQIIIHIISIILVIIVFKEEFKQLLTNIKIKKVRK